MNSYESEARLEDSIIEIHNKGKKIIQIIKIFII